MQDNIEEQMHEVFRWYSLMQSIYEENPTFKMLLYGNFANYAKSTCGTILLTCETILRNKCCSYYKVYRQTVLQAHKAQFVLAWNNMEKQ